MLGLPEYLRLKLREMRNVLLSTLVLVLDIFFLFSFVLYFGWWLR
jgi:hypothetical protein